MSKYSWKPGDLRKASDPKRGHEPAKKKKRAKIPRKKGK